MFDSMIDDSFDHVFESNNVRFDDFVSYQCKYISTFSLESIPLATATATATAVGLLTLLLLLSLFAWRGNLSFFAVVLTLWFLKMESWSCLCCCLFETCPFSVELISFSLAGFDWMPQKIVGSTPVNAKERILILLYSYWKRGRAMPNNTTNW